MLRCRGDWTYYLQPAGRARPLLSLTRGSDQAQSQRENMHKVVCSLNTCVSLVKNDAPKSECKEEGLKRIAGGRRTDWYNLPLFARWWLGGNPAPLLGAGGGGEAPQPHKEVHRAQRQHMYFAQQCILQRCAAYLAAPHSGPQLGTTGPGPAG